MLTASDTRGALCLVNLTLWGVPWLFRCMPSTDIPLFCALGLAIAGLVFTAITIVLVNGDKRRANALLMRRSTALHAEAERVI